jgi:hypothetical protein
MKKMQIATLTGAVALALGSIASAQAAGFTSDGWNASFDGELHGFYVATKGDSLGTTKSFSDSAISNGFNPSKFNAHFAAPSYDGLNVTGNFQYATNISNGANGSGGVDVRVLDINVAGSFGTISIGRSWAIYDGSAIVAEEGTGGVGVGNLCLGTSQITNGAGGGTCGRIGTGYTWTNFDARIEYDTPDMGGFGLRVGVFDGGSGKQTGTGTTASNRFKNSPRVEAEGTFAGKFDGGSYKVWLGALSQNLSANPNNPTQTASSKLQGTDFGARVDMGGLAVAGNYSDTKGFGLAGFKYGGLNCNAAGTTCDPLKAKFMYLDVSYKVSNTRFGVSTGTGKQDEMKTAGVTADKLKATHSMLYVHHNLTPQAVLTLEYDTVKVKDEGPATPGDLQKYNLWAVGLNYYF